MRRCRSSLAYMLCMQVIDCILLQEHGSEYPVDMKSTVSFYLFGILSPCLTSPLPANNAPDVNVEPIIPEIFVTTPDKPFIPNPPDPVDASWLTFKTIKDLAYLPYDEGAPAANIRSPDIPGVTIGLKPQRGDTLQTRYQMWALMRCLQFIGPDLMQQGHSPRCNFGFELQPPRPGEEPHIDIPLGRLHFLKTPASGTDKFINTVLDTDAANEGGPEPFLPAGNTSIFSETPEFNTALGFESFPAPPFDVDDDIKYTATLSNWQGGDQSIPVTLLTSALSYIEICQAASPRSREEKVVRRQKVIIHNPTASVEVHYQLHDQDDPPDYEGYVESFAAVERELRRLRRWEGADFAVYRVSDRMRVLEGEIRKVESPREGGTVSVETA